VLGFVFVVGFVNIVFVVGSLMFIVVLCNWLKFVVVVLVVNDLWFEVIWMLSDIGFDFFLFDVEKNEI